MYGRRKYYIEHFLKKNMGLQQSRFRGKVKIHGRPQEQAKAEIMLMKQKEAYENRQRRRRFFTALDIAAVLGFLGGAYSFYLKSYLNGALLVGLGIVILGYFLLRKTLRNKK